MGKVLLVACTNVGRSLIETICERTELKEIELVGVVNLNPKVGINKANYDSYIDLQFKYNLNMYYCSNINEPECIGFMQECKPDIIIQSGWSQKFSDIVLNIPKYVCIGEHPAPLPMGRGAACINWAILTGEREWGDTFFKMESEYDAGVIYSQKFFNIELEDDVKTVYDKVAEAAVCSIVENLNDWTNGRLKSVKQDDSQSTHYPRRCPEDGLLDFGGSATDVYNAIRAQARPYPGAFFYSNHDGHRVKIYIWKARINTIPNAREIEIVCGDGQTVVLNRVQMDGHPEMWAEDFYRNYTDIFSGLIIKSASK